MALKHKTHDIERAAVVQRTSKPAVRTENESEQVSLPSSALDRIVTKPLAALRPADILTLQRTVGNRAVQRMLSNQPHSRSSSPSTSAQTIQRQTEEEEPLQAKFDTSRRSENRTGLPDKLKAGIENLSCLSLDDVRVHRNSSRPAQVHALAYTQGTDIHVAPGQEQHLPHEAWHVVQQKQGRVRPTLQAKGQPINDDHGLEREADVMGAKAVSASGMPALSWRSEPGKTPQPGGGLIQRTNAKVDDKTVINLDTEETAGGHTIARHVGKDNEFIHNRTIDNQMDAASTFPDKTTATAVVNAAVQANKTAINAIVWGAQAPPANKAFSYNANKSIGQYLDLHNVQDKKGRERKLKALKADATRATLVIHMSWQASTPHQWYVLTCYPNPP